MVEVFEEVVGDFEGVVVGVDILVYDDGFGVFGEDFVVGEVDGLCYCYVLGFCGFCFLWEWRRVRSEEVVFYVGGIGVWDGEGNLDIGFEEGVEFGIDCVELCGVIGGDEVGVEFRKWVVGEEFFVFVGEEVIVGVVSGVVVEVECVCFDEYGVIGGVDFVDGGGECFGGGFGICGVDVEVFDFVGGGLFLEFGIGGELFGDWG